MGAEMRFVAESAFVDVMLIGVLSLAVATLTAPVAVSGAVLLLPTNF